jgi:RNA polymerase II subunit A C-terminal domain phosphatase
VSYNTSAPDSERAPINMVHGNTALMVSEDEAARAEEEAKRRLLANRKLSLVVDLDQTVIQATVDPTVAEWQKDESNPNYEAVKDVQAFQLVDDGPGARGCWYYIKLRPGLLKFLDNISKLYELHIYTMGTRAYAHNIAKIIDPDRKIFGDRILSRDESGNLLAKNLHRLFPVDTKMVVIIDDRGDVWNWSDNLVKVPAYDFFVGIGDINSSFLPRRQELQSQSKALNIDTKFDSSNREESDGNVTVSEDPVDTKQPSPKTENNSSPPAKAEDAKSRTLENQLVAMAGGDNPSILKEQSHNQDEAIAAQVTDRPLLQKQKMLDKADEEAEKNEQNGTEPSDEDHKHPRHTLLHDSDDALEYLEHCLRRVHQKFYEAYEMESAGSYGGRVADLRGSKGVKISPYDNLRIVPDIKELMPAMKQAVLKGVHIVFSGVVPLGIKLQ